MQVLEVTLHLAIRWDFFFLRKMYVDARKLFNEIRFFLAAVNECGNSSKNQ